jgi:gliding motility-associated-like protein
MKRILSPWSSLALPSRAVGIAVAILFFLTTQGFANKPEHIHAGGHENEWKVQFIQNLGQWEPQIKFMAHVPGGKVFIEEDKLTFAIADVSNLHDRFFHPQEGGREDRPLIIQGHAFQILFPGSNPSPEIQATGKYDEYHNYFVGSDRSKWKGNVPLFAKLRLKEIWPGVDLILLGDGNKLKYEFEVRGGNPANIKLQYVGLDAIEIDPLGGMRLRTSVGDVTDAAPVSFPEGSYGEPSSSIQTRFKQDGTTIGFEFWNPNENEWSATAPSSLFTIDPSLVFGSYTGSTSDNFGYTATYDTAGNLYGGGIAFGLGYPTTAGAFQVAYGGGAASPFGGGFDISISKFNPTGTALVWSSFLGGSGNEQPHSLIANNAGELMVYGRTNSANFPVTPGAFQTAFAGQEDIIVTKINAAGSALIGSTYLGGSGRDGLNIHTTFATSSLYQNYGDDARGEIMIDGNGNIYVASCTQSNNFPVTPGVLQGAFGGGQQDGVVVKFNPGLTGLIWSTYLGGSGNDAAYSMKIGAGNEPYVAGGTESANFPVTAGTISNNYRGAIDGFISRLNSTATGIVASTFIGTNAYDQCYFLELDQAGDVYVVGQTRGAFPVTAGVFSNPNSGQFVAKYSPTLNTTFFSTVFGTGGFQTNISPTAFLVDRCGFIYVSGWGGFTNYSGTTTGLPTTPGAFQTTTDGSDIYLIVLQPDATGIEYATFYGGNQSDEHVDGGTSRFDPNLVVYQAVCAGCGSFDDFPTTPGAVSQTNNSFNCNLGVFKFAFDAQEVIANYTSIALDSCAPFPVNFTNNSQGGLSYFWDFGDGTTATTFNASHVYTVPGTYTVILVAVDSSSCNFSDTAVSIITVYGNPLGVVNQTDTACAGGTVQLLATGGQIYEWSPPTGLNNPFIGNPVATVFANTQYQVIIADTNGCRDTGYVDINVTNLIADAGPPSGFCEGTGGTQLSAGPINGGLQPYYYTWWCDSTNTFCGLDSVYDNDPVALPTATAWYYLQIQDSRGCVSNVDSVLVEVLPLPIADAGPDQFICQFPAPGALLTGSVSNAPGPYVYTWINGTGLNDSTLLNPYARPDTTTIYALVVTSSNGCSSTLNTLDTVSTVTVHVLPRPIADAGPDIHACFRDTVQLQGVGFGAGPDYEYEWSPSTGLSSDTVSTPFGSPPSTTVYTFVVWSNGCPSFGDTMTYWVHTLPTPNAGNIVEVCLGESGQLDAFGAGDSTATYTYSWTPAAGLDDPTAENPFASPDTTTWYSVEVLSSWGCRSHYDSVLVRVKPTPIAEAGPVQQLCLGDTVQLQGSYFYTSTDSAPTSEVFFAWSPNLSLSDSTIQDPFAFPAGSQQYYLDVIHNTCRTRDSVLVIVSPQISGTIGGDTSVVCAGDSVRLFVTGGNGGATVQWQPAAQVGDPTSFTTFVAVANTTMFTATITQGGCSEDFEFLLNAIPRPTAEFDASQLVGCPPHTVSLTDLSSGALALVWNFGDGTPVSNQPQVTHTFNSPGEYPVQLIAINTGGCSDTAAIAWVSVGDTALVDFSSDPAFPCTLAIPGSSVQFFNQSQNAGGFVWDFGDGIQSVEFQPTHVFSTPGSYFVTLRGVSPDGCPGVAIHGPYLIQSPDLFIPNVFSPNGDGLNDGFRPDYTGDQPYVIQIFDRWGNLLFNSNNKTTYWDGLDDNGNPVPEGVYYFRISVGSQSYAGDVTLVR